MKTKKSKSNPIKVTDIIDSDLNAQIQRTTFKVNEAYYAISQLKKLLNGEKPV